MSVVLPPAWRRLLDTPLRELLLEGPTGSLGWRVLLARSDMPEPIDALITQVVNKTGLSRAEKHGVTAELLAHFQDGLEAGATATELTDSFGDPVAAAKLIRRAKRRCRPLLRQSVSFLSRAMLAACVAYLIYGAYLLVQRPQPTIDYLAVVNSSVANLPAETIGWPLYREALASLQRKALERAGDALPRPDRWGDPLSEWQGESFSQLKPDTRETARIWLDAHQEELALFREAAAYPHLGVKTAPLWEMSEDFHELFHLGAPGVRDPDSEDLYSILLPHTQAMGRLGRVLFTNFTHAADRGDGIEAYADLQAILGVAQHAEEHPFLVCYHIGIHIRGKAYGAVHESLRDHPGLWSDRQLKQIAHLIARPPRPLSFYLDGEKAMVLDMLQRVYSARGDLTLSGLRRLGRWSDGLGAPILLTNNAESSLLVRFGQYLALPGFAIALSDREEATRLLESFFDAARNDAASPLWKLAQQQRADGVRQTAENENVVLSLLIPATSAAKLAYERSEGIRHGTLIGIALELYRRDKDAWPESLDALAPRWIPELPVDPINGGPLGYRIVDGEPVVYSLGIDRDDDGGTQPAAMNPGSDRNVGYGWRRYPPGPPLDRPMTEDSRWWEDGDWVLWSLAEPRYMPETAGETRR